MGKGQIACYEQFLFFPQLFQKTCTADTEKPGLAWEMVKMGVRNRERGGFFFLNPFPNKPWFLRVWSARLLKTPWEKEKLLVTSNFSFFHSVFYPFGVLSAILIKFEIVVCKLFHFGRV